MHPSSHPSDTPDAITDAWMSHPEVVAALNDSFDEVERGATQGACEFDEFLRRLDADK